jgi:hypothetical protein
MIMISYHFLITHVFLDFFLVAVILIAHKLKANPDNLAVRLKLLPISLSKYNFQSCLLYIHCRLH